MTRKLLIVSLLANAALIVALAVGLRGPGSDESPAPGSAPTAAPQPSTPVTSQFAARHDEIRTDDLDEYLEILRGLALPDSVVRAIIIAEIDARYADRIAALEMPAGEFEFWKTGAAARTLFMPNAQQLRQREAVLAEKRAHVTRLLGSESDLKLRRALAERERIVRRLFAYLPAGRRAALERVQREFAARELVLAARFLGDTAGQNARRQLRLERERALAGVLEPAEFEYYLLIASRTAQDLRVQLAGFEPSKEEFLAIFRAQKELDDLADRVALGENGDVFEARLLATLTRLDKHLKLTLGEQRYADYRRTTD